MKYIIQSAMQKNSKPFKPMEDFCLCDEQNGIFIVTDGVTQSAEDYALYMGQSDAGAVAELSARTVHETLLACGNSEQSLIAGARLAIERVAEYNKTAKASFPPATCIVAACLSGDRLSFASIGDSVIYLLRGSAKIQLAEEQTRLPSLYRRLAGVKTTKREMYDNHTNNISSPMGYGVILGDLRAMDFLHTASIRLEPGDRVIVSSDGIDSYLLFTPFAQIKPLSPADMIAASIPYDNPPFSDFADDKSIITIDVVE